MEHNRKSMGYVICHQMHRIVHQNASKCVELPLTASNCLQARRIVSKCVEECPHLSKNVRVSPRTPLSPSPSPLQPYPRRHPLFVELRLNYGGPQFRLWEPRFIDATEAPFLPSRTSLIRTRVHDTQIACTRNPD